MDTALLVVTLAALALTGTLLIYLARVLREERERSEARVAALADEIRSTTGRSEPPVGRTPAVDTPTRLDLGTSFRDLPRGVGAHRPDAGHERRQAPAGDFVLRRPPGEGDTAPLNPAPTPALFADSAQSPDTSTSRRLLGPLVGALVVGLAVATIWLFAGGDGTRGTSAPTAAAATDARPLELLALTHERQNDTLTVSGLVRNPVGQSPRTGLAAVVFVFDRAGTFVTSARADIDYQALGPGDESPFVVKVPNATAVARYRVSFRDEQAVVGHVDARTSGKPAAEQ